MFFSPAQLAVLMAITALAAKPSFAQTRTVTSLADDGGPGTLRAQVAAAIASGQSTGTINFAVSGTITLGSPIDVRYGGIDGGGRITISGGGKVQLFRVLSAGYTPTFLNLTLTGGKGDCGGAILNHGILQLVNVTVRGNTAVNGGAICSPDEHLLVQNSTFENNSADLTTGRGGAIYLGFEGFFDAVNTTFTNNRAAFGGAIANTGAFTARIYSSTIARNTAQSGGGLYLGLEQITSATYSLRNNIFSNNTGGNCGTRVLQPQWGDLGGNLSYPDNTCPGLVADPRLEALDNNGGPTRTMALQAGSAAINHAPTCVTASGASLTVDQRGFPRPQGPACDSGSYERSALSFTGFFWPIANPPVVNRVNAPQVIPISFSLGRFAGMNIFAAGYPASRQVSCDTGQAISQLTEIDTPGRSGLVFDVFHNRYEISWKTEKSWEGQCRQLVVRLTDGIDHTALFRFR